MDIFAQFQNELDVATLGFDSKLDYDISRLLLKLKLTVGVAESITGGMLSQRIAKLPGSNNFYVGGITCYHPLIKINICGVSPKTLNTYGISSKNTALELVRGAKRVTKAHVCLATAGKNHQNVNPQENTKEKVFLGFIFNNDEHVKPLVLDGTLENIQGKSTQATLAFFRQWLLVQESLINKNDYEYTT
jgi:PncC family amidohydrolase